MSFEKNRMQEEERIELEAAEWLARLDCGLSGEEQDDYIEWMSRDERHRKAVKALQWSWQELDRLAGLQTTLEAPVNRDLLGGDDVPPGKFKGFTRHWKSVASVGIAAVLVFGLLILSFFDKGSDREYTFEPAYELMQRLEQQELADGTKVELNRGAVIRTQFTKAARLVQLDGGEANFIVAKDPDRPFIVSAGGVEVKAIGTVFNVVYVGNAVDVIVSEGKVQLESASAGDAMDEAVGGSSFLTAGQKASVQWGESEATFTIETLDKQDLASALNWQPRMLKFRSASLFEIIQGFNQHNQIQVVLGDPELESLVLTSAFWSDNVEGFIRLMESNYGIRASWIDRHVIRLGRDVEDRDAL